MLKPPKRLQIFAKLKGKADFLQIVNFYTKLSKFSKEFYFIQLFLCRTLYLNAS